MAALGVALIVIMAAGLTIWHYSRASEILTRWAQNSDYEIVSSRRCWFWRGPFFWASKSQEVYYVTVRTADGQLRRGWVRCGGMFLGVLSDEAKVRWDE
jgi:hypothetical protein